VSKKLEKHAELQLLIRAYRILPYVARATLPSISKLGKRNITEFKGMDEAVFIAYPSANDEHLRSAFQTLATRNQDRFSFGVTDPSLGRAEQISPGCVVCYRKEYREQKMLCGESKLETLENFMEMATEPAIEEMTRKNELRYLKVRNRFPRSFVADLKFPVWEISGLCFCTHRERAFAVQKLIEAIGREIRRISQLRDY